MFYENKNKIKYVKTKSLFNNEVVTELIFVVCAVIRRWNVNYFIFIM